MSNDFTGWIKTDEHFSGITPSKMRVRRADGSQGYSIAKFKMDRRAPELTQEYWEDLNGDEHNKDYYPEWAFLIKNGGKAK